MSKPNDWFGIKCDKHQDQLLYVLNVIFQQQKKNMYICMQSHKKFNRNTKKKINCSNTDLTQNHSDLTCIHEQYTSTLEIID